MSCTGRIYFAYCFMRFSQHQQFHAGYRYKTDTRLVKTVSAILLAVAFCLLSGFAKREFFPIVIVGITSSADLAVIDFFHTANGTINKIYRADGWLQAIFLVAWIYLLLNTKTLGQQKVPKAEKVHRYFYTAHNK